MEIYNKTGVTKTGALRITKRIGMLLFTYSKAFSALTTETVTIYIKRANGDNDKIATDISLKSLIATSVFGEGHMLDDGSSLSAACEISINGGISMGENEVLVVSMKNLKSADTYTINGLELPILSNQLVRFDKKRLLAGEKSRTYNVAEFDKGYIDGDFTKVNLVYQTDQGNKTVEYSKKELRSISADLGLLRSGSHNQITDTCISLVEVIEIELFASNAVNLILRG